MPGGPGWAGQWHSGGTDGMTVGCTPGWGGGLGKVLIPFSFPGVVVQPKM